MDWLRFYWDYRTNAGTKPSHRDIFDHVGFARDVYPWASNQGAYDSMLEAIEDGGLGQLDLLMRWLDSAEWNGVDL